MDRISAILADPNSPVSQLMVSNRLPCCGFVTAMQMALAGRVPTNPDKLGNWNFPSDNEWERGCLWAGYGHWDNLPKPRFILTPIEPLVLDYILTTRPHTWWEVQVWNRDYSSGHNYLLHFATGDKPLRLVDSTTSRGLRDREIARWTPLDRHTHVGMSPLHT